MVNIKVTIIAGRERKILDRPLHVSDGTFAVTYKNKKWRVDSKLQVDIKKDGPLSEKIVFSFATDEQARNLLSRPTALPHTPGITKSAHRSTPLPTPPARQPVALPSPPRPKPRLSDLDTAQREVVTSGPEKRLLVDAGPGTGKTAVACARVAWLVQDQQISAGSIWLISFSRTAVEEIRTRIAEFADQTIANAVQIATIDSMAGQLNRTQGRTPANTFDENIRRLFSELDDNQTIKDYLAELQHVIVDEAQDIVGDRADLVEKLIGNLPETCGISVFFDLAQSIYGFAKGDTAATRNRKTDAIPDKGLAERLIRQASNMGFERLFLVDVHRTNDTKLKEIFTAVRRKVLDDKIDPSARHATVQELLGALAHGAAEQDIEKAIIGLEDDSFILFRARLAALMAARRLGDKPYRIRISGTPTVIAPWIAATLGEASENRIGLDSFRKLWSDTIISPVLAKISPDAAFDLLVQFAPTQSGKVDLTLLRRKLAARPNRALSSPDIGTSGPIIGTIHAAKGREANTVILNVPPTRRDNSNSADHDEEARVLFVGATRARHKLQIANGFNIVAEATEQGRSFRFKTGEDGVTCDLEIGRDGDLDATGLAGRTYFEDPQAVRAAHSIWITAAANHDVLEAYNRRFDEEWRYGITTAYAGPVLAILSRSFNDDTYYVVKEARRRFRLEGMVKSPAKLHPLRVVGLTTIALSAKNPELNGLLEPWSKTGLILAPLLTGLVRFRIKS